VLTQSELKEELSYDPLTGVFLRLNKTAHNAVVGKPAGGVDKNGYVHISVKGNQYYAHRLAWLYVYGEWPEKHIDHVNRVRTDNRLENLREASHQDNMQNIEKPCSRNESGYRGVSTANAATGTFTVQLCVNRKKVYLGTFYSAEEAHEAYLKAKAEHHPSFKSTKDLK
jgi:hypothetical protein